MVTLYRKYRPQNFTEVVGQNHIKMILQHEIEADKVAHAYLFCGPRAVGKTTLARVFAKAVNCENRQEGKYEPCGSCQACQEITEGRSFDIVEIDAASHTGVDNVRENIIANARVAPSRLKRKVFIIDEVHMLSTQAFNALLKTLEEPPANVIFILCTTEIHKVPSTIISRCQRFDFKKISLNEQVKRLNSIVNKEEIKIDKAILEAIARHSAGHMRDAESLLGQLVNIGGKEITREEADLVVPRSDISEVINLIDCLSKKDAGAGIRLVNRLVDEGVDLKIFSNDLIEVLRKLMIMKINPTLTEKLSLDLGESLELKLSEVSGNLAVEQILSFIEQFMKTVNELKGSFILQLPLEIAIAKLCIGTVVNFQPSPTTPTVKPVASASPAAEKPVKPLTNQDGKFNHDEILEKWNEFLVRVKKYNHSLSFILRVCQPRSINGREICLVFKYKFHKDRVNDPNIKGIIEKALAETYNANLTFEAIIDESLEMENVPSVSAGESEENANANEAPVVDSSAEAKSDGNGMIDNLLKSFGGKVVG